MRKVHAVVGVAMLIAFLGTGQYMDRVHGHLAGMSDARRMLFRSDHIYLLLTAVLNLALGLYLTPREPRRARAVQLLGSIAIVIAPFLFLIAFFTEPWMTHLARPWTRPAIYAVFGGGLAHLLAAFTVDPR
jgi:drug/metabolite transporter (DMT)-like permease